MGIVYFIQCLETGEIYIGSTKQTIKKRMKGHRSDSKDNNKNSCSSKQIIDRGNYIYEILEEVDNDILREREQYYIETTDCINMSNSFTSDEDKKEQNKICMKRFREKNPNYRKVKITCECGEIIIKDSKARHIKSKKHQKLLSLCIKN